MDVLPFADCTRSTSEVQVTESPRATSYDAKPLAYFQGCRRDIVDDLPASADAAVLELGCGDGATGRYALTTGKAGVYVGIEISATAAQIAARSLTEVLVGNVEQLDLRRFHGRFDALIISEVLEHLVDPWTTLRALALCLKPGAPVYASSPNISHRLVIANLLVGRFEYEPVGIYDLTHLRWFTPSSFRRMFEHAGFVVDQIGPLGPPGWKAMLIDRLTFRRFTHLFISQIMLRGHRAH
jgi:2-polyprenyl-3-methyl-5-hydroxy-6-metoxy-1,4-benzoquinol methylase